MRVTMVRQVSGTRAGVAWPGPGGEVEVDDDEGARLCASGLASPVKVDEEPETRPRRRSKGDK